MDDINNCQGLLIVLSSHAETKAEVFKTNRYIGQLFLYIIRCKTEFNNCFVTYLSKIYHAQLKFFKTITSSVFFLSF